MKRHTIIVQGKGYQDNPDAFEQYNVDRIFVPRTKQIEAETTEDDDKDAKLTAEQKRRRKRPRRPTRRRMKRP